MVRWWEERAELDRMHARGDVELVPVERQFEFDGSTKQPQLDVYSHRPHHVVVTAAAVVAGDRVGWLTREGALMPDASVFGRVLSSAATQSRSGGRRGMRPGCRTALGPSMRRISTLPATPD